MTILANMTAGQKLELQSAIDLVGDPTARRTKAAPSQVALRALAGFMQVLPSPSYDGRTYQTILTCECPWIGYRVVLRNNGPAYTLNACATSSDNGGAASNPSPANWQQVTFGGSASVTVPAALGTNRPSILYSDIVWDASILRNDDPARLPLLYVRTYYATGPATGYGNTSNPVQDVNGWLGRGAGNSYNKGRLIGVLGAAGDFTSTNQAGFAGASPNPNFGMHVGEVEFITMRNVMTVLALGDSISQGDAPDETGTPYHILSPVHMACALVSTQAKPIIAANQGFSSQTTTNFLNRLQDMIAAGRKPNVIVYSAYSPNDISGAGGSNTAIAGPAIQIMRQNLYQALALMRANGIYPIISTGLPYAYSAAVDALRIAFNNELRALAANGAFDLADYDALLSSGSTPANIKFPDYAIAANTLHPYNAGYTAMGEQVLAPVLQRVANRFFI